MSSPTDRVSYRREPLIPRGDVRTLWDAASVQEFGGDPRRAIRDQLEVIDYNLRTAGGGIDSGARNEYLREGLFALHEAVAGLASVIEQLVDRDADGA